MDFGLEELVQGYGRKRVLDGVTMELAEGVTGLLGPNGAGKTTLMRTLATQLPPRAGHVVIGGRTVKRRRDALEARGRIGYLSQSFGYDPRFSVREHVEYLAWLREVPSNLRRALVSEAVARVGLERDETTRMGALSGGMRQRAGIAGAIVGTPALLILDEPTVGLDPEQRASFRDLVRSRPAPRILLSTHLIEDVQAMAERVVVLTEGQIRYDGTLAAFAGSRYPTIEAAYLSMVSGPVEEVTL